MVGSRCCIHNINPTHTPLHSFHSSLIGLLLCVSPNSYSLKVRFVASTAPIVPLHGESIIDCQTTIAASYTTQEGGRIAEYKGSEHSDAVVTSSRACMNQRVTRCVCQFPYTPPVFLICSYLVRLYTRPVSSHPVPLTSPQRDVNPVTSSSVDGVLGDGYGSV